MALVDHNICVPGVSSLLGDRVVTIVDHHNDEKKFLATGIDGSDDLSGMLQATAPVRVIDQKIFFSLTTICSPFVWGPLDSEAIARIFLANASSQSVC